ncbi:MAG: universal stress protein [bacterium]|nr:universal stress protein [bacterium]
MFEHILIPLDFTEKNDPAIDVGRQMAGSMQSRLTLLHVIQEIEGAADEEMRAFYGTLEGRARTALSRLQIDLANEEIEAETAIAFGKRPEEIVRFAAEGGVDLIVMSSHKLDPRAPAQPWPTISHKVAVFSSCPVLLVR